MVDAHAAHERALFEHLTRTLGAAPGGAARAGAATPDPEQTARLHERGPELQGWGLTLEDFGAGLARLRTLPAALAPLNVPRLHEQIVESALGTVRTRAGTCWRGWPARPR